MRPRIKRNDHPNDTELFSAKRCVSSRPVPVRTPRSEIFPFGLCDVDHLGLVKLPSRYSWPRSRLRPQDALLFSGALFAVTRYEPMPITYCRNEVFSVRFHDVGWGAKTLINALEWHVLSGRFISFAPLRITSFAVETRTKITSSWSWSVPNGPLRG